MKAPLNDAAELDHVSVAAFGDKVLQARRGYFGINAILDPRRGLGAASSPAIESFSRPSHQVSKKPSSTKPNLVRIFINV